MCRLEIIIISTNVHYFHLVFLNTKCEPIPKQVFTQLDADSCCRIHSWWKKQHKNWCMDSLITYCRTYRIKHCCTARMQSEIKFTALHEVSLIKNSILKEPSVNLYIFKYYFITSYFSITTIHKHHQG